MAIFQKKKQKALKRCFLSLKDHGRFRKLNWRKVIICLKQGFLQIWEAECSAIVQKFAYILLRCFLDQRNKKGWGLTQRPPKELPIPGPLVKLDSSHCNPCGVRREVREWAPALPAPVSLQLQVRQDQRASSDLTPFVLGNIAHAPCAHKGQRVI